ncbi:MAG: alpha/beta hydrolase [Arenicellales bacterium]
MPFIQSTQIQLHYLDNPAHDGSESTPLILMPGLTANVHSFDGLINAGLSQSRRVLTVDLRGRGLSDHPNSGYSMADHATDIIGMMDVLGLDKVNIGGHSFGGLLAMYLAAHYPERIHQLVIIDAAGQLHPDARQLIQPAIDRLAQTYASFEVYLAQVKQFPFYLGWWDDDLDTYYHADVITLTDGQVKPRSNPAHIVEAIDKGLLEDWAAHIQKIEQPLLLLNALGAYGPVGAPPLLTKALAMETVNAVTKGQYVEIEGNHQTMLFAKGAGQIVRAVQAFLASSF